jgi:hypothetical protein
MQEIQKQVTTVFLSYAHDDNRNPRGIDSPGWVSFFDESLSLELVGRGLIDVKLWRDTRDLDEAGLVKSALEKNVQVADLFLAVLSPLYVVKEYTTFELTTFAKTRAGEPILLVLKRPLPTESYPPAIRGMYFVPFFELNRESDEHIPFFEYGAVDKGRYWDSIRKVARLIEKIHRTKRTSPRTNKAAGGPASTGALGGGPAQTDAASAAIASTAVVQPAQTSVTRNVTVFLAEPSNDMADQHWLLSKELDSGPCRVVPTESDSEAGGLTKAGSGENKLTENGLKSAIAGADFSIHLLGATGGPRVADQSLAKLQLGLAAARVKDKPDFKRLIWAPSDQQLTDPEQRQLIDDLEQGKSLLREDDFVRSSLEQFKDIVREQLAKY